MQSSLVLFIRSFIHNLFVIWLRLLSFLNGLLRLNRNYFLRLWSSLLTRLRLRSSFLSRLWVRSYLLNGLRLRLSLGRRSLGRLLFGHG